MSLDVYLTKSIVRSECDNCGHKKFENDTVYESNITHNLAGMAKAAGIYEALWRPDEIDEDPKAALLVPLLEEGLKRLKANPSEYTKYNAANGWGLYEHFVPFVEKYLEACKDYPDADVSVFR